MNSWLTDLRSSACATFRQADSLRGCYAKTVFDTLSQCVDALGLTRSVEQPDAHLSRGAALHFLLPTGHENILVMPDSRSGRSSFESKLISLLPLDDVPVHVHRFAARVPCDSKGSGRPGVSVESIQPRPPRPCEVARPKGGEGKTDANLTHFF